MSSKRTLKEILDSEYVDEDADELIQEEHTDEAIENDDNEEELDPTLCIECTDMKTEILCNDCQEHFCVVCFEMIHRNGRRKKHEYIKLTADGEQRPASEEEQKRIQDANNNTNNTKEGSTVSHHGVTENANESKESIDVPMTNDENSFDQKMLAILSKHAQYIPMRLTF